MSRQTLVDRSVPETSCSLELNIHQLILSDLAANIGESKDDPNNADIVTSIELVTSQVETRVVPEENPEQPERVFMVSPARSVAKSVF